MTYSRMFLDSFVFASDDALGDADSLVSVSRLTPEGFFWPNETRGRLESGVTVGTIGYVDPNGLLLTPASVADAVYPVRHDGTEDPRRRELLRGSSPTWSELRHWESMLASETSIDEPSFDRSIWTIEIERIEGRLPGGEPAAAYMLIDRHIDPDNMIDESDGIFGPFPDRDGTLIALEKILSRSADLGKDRWHEIDDLWNFDPPADPVTCAEAKADFECFREWHRRWRGLPDEEVEMDRK